MDSASQDTLRATNFKLFKFREGCVAEANASFIAPHKINDEIKATVPDPQPRSEIRLYSYSSSHIRSLCGWGVNSSGYTLRGRLGDDVEQNFTHLARASPDRIALLIL